jgi:POT family proton-dependent oligopeptide transporter
MSNVQTKLMTRLCVIEMWERFAYYGMRSLLALFMIKQLGFDEGKAYLIYGLYAAICYIVPVLAGSLADRLLGYKNLLFSGSILMCFGHGILAFCAFDDGFLYLGIASIAIGTGFFKGNISNMLGSIYGEHHNAEREHGFRRFYIAINFGSFIASILCGFIAEIYGWHYAFGLAGFGMIIGFITLLYSQDILANFGNPPKNPVIKMHSKIQKSISYIIGAILIGLSTLMFYFYETSIQIISALGMIIFIHLLYITRKYDKKSQGGIFLILMMLGFFMVMFALEMQLGSFINLFTEKHINRDILGITLPTASLQSLNPLTIIIIGSVISYIFRKIEAKYTLLLFGIGFFMACICFGILYIGCHFYDIHFKMHIGVLVSAMVFLALSEIMMAPIIQSVITYIAPKQIRGYMMGFVMLCLSYSNIIGSIILKNMLNIDKAKVYDQATIESLLNYQNCFLKVTITFALISILYVMCYKLMVRIYVSFN